MGRILQAVVSGLLLTSVLGDNCPYKECYCGGDDIFCDDRYLKAIPQRLLKKNLWMRTLNLNDNEISTIPARALPGNLSEITLQSNPIETIDDTAFDESNNTLQKLTFSQARFTQLPKAVLHLKALTSLSIYETKILVWDEEDMKQFAPTLNELNLDTVGLTTWPTWIQSYAHLTELSITGSSISSLPDNAFDLISNILTGLSLSNNSLTTVPKALSKLIALESLSLDQNRITDITWLPQVKTITTLLLHNNRISDASKLSTALRVHAKTMYYFDIHDNYLTSIPDLDFLTLVTSIDYTNNHISDPNSGSIPPGLTDLDLENNLLPSIPSILKSLPSAPNLVLNHNRITAIQGNDFPSSTTGVDLGYNLLTELTDTSFPVNSNITSLLLNYNPISFISPRAFLNVPRLNELNLQHSRLTRLPLTIASLTSLEMIDVSGSTSLVCTCLEKSLERVIKSMMPDNVVGNCGHTSVYIFFTQLSPYCPPMS